MSREVILYIAASLDGFIAEADGGIDFLGGGAEVVEAETSYQELMEKIDTVVMGRTTYDQVANELSPEHYPYEEQNSYIITNHPEKNHNKITFTNQSPTALIKQLQTEAGKAIWIVGGSRIITPLVEANLIDTYIITTIPVILGKGIPLFREFDGAIKVRAEQVSLKNGMIYSTYSRYKK
ncbi:dihydrofolate reductase [Erwinia sp. CPCC 100877]|nr:dihydrofolate reductase [Erwinia sp. CPCC 100877]